MKAKIARIKAKPTGNNGIVPKGKTARTTPKTVKIADEITNTFLIILLYFQIQFADDKVNCPVPTGMLNLIKTGIFFASVVIQIKFLSVPFKAFVLAAIEIL